MSKILLTIATIVVGFYTNIASGQTVRINEVMASNSQIISDHNSKYSDWIEIYNESETSINMEGWSLTDDINFPRKWIFPNTTLSAKSYLVIFASGKDTLYSNGEIHTNFKLNAYGEYLAFADPQKGIRTEFHPSYPAMKEDQSLGWLDSGWVTFIDPTPGQANSTNSAIILPSPTLSHKHGLYSIPFELTIDPQFENSVIFYTSDGSVPTNQSTSYTKPIQVENTTIIRCISYVPNIGYSKNVTQSYIFPTDVVLQDNEPDGYPKYWGDYTAIPGTSIADYEMDPELIADPQKKQDIIDALYSLPIISLVSDKDNLFSHEEDENKGGIYIFTGAPGNDVGKGWERPVSAEYFNTAHGNTFQVDCSIQLHGGHSRRPEKAPKHSFRLNFKSKYGPSKLNFPMFEDTHITSFDNLVLRAGFGNSWTHWQFDERKRAQNGRDTWSKDTQLDMGQISAHSNFAHLFINGIYWGIYNPLEKVTGEFAADYMGGNPEDYDIIKDHDELANGQWDAWQNLHSLVRQDIKVDENYYFLTGKNKDGTENPEIESYIDIDNLIDYMLINFYGGNTDWDHHNWIVLRNRINPGEGFKFLAWDQEHVLKETDENTTDEYNSGCPSYIFQKLTQNAIFKRTFADRVLAHCTNNGLLTPNLNAERWMQRSEVLEKAVDAESARWGDYRRDVHSFSSSPFQLYTKEDHWLPAREKLLNDYFPVRTEILLEQLRDKSLYPEVDAPYFTLNGNSSYYSQISNGEQLEMLVDEGEIFYTMNGTDPAVWDGDEGSISPNSNQFTNAIKLEKSVKVCARTYHNGEWSAMRSAYFQIANDLYDLKVTEIHYNPLADSIEGDKYEFIEIKNTGESTLNLNGIDISEGISYEFISDFVLPPDSFVVLASDETRFYQRYRKAASGEYSGNLANDKDKITISHSSGDTINVLTYYDDKDWPKEADGYGNSLVPMEFNPIKDQNIAKNWRISYRIGGSPFSDDTEIPDGIEDKLAFNETQFKAFPNPFSQILYFNITPQLTNSSEIIIYNILGEPVRNIEITNNESMISWNGTSNSGEILSKGIYIAKIISTDQYQNKTLRLIKQ